MDDKVLVKSCLAGDEKACKTLFDLYSGAMFALCLRYSSCRQDAEDSLQDGFIKVFQNLGSWRSEGPLGGWIRRIMINTCITRQKSSIRQHAESLNEEFSESSMPPEIMSDLGVSEIECLIDQMPQGYKMVFKLSIIDGYSYEEISNLLQITESTCRSQLFKAKHYLARKIRQLHPQMSVSI